MILMLNCCCCCYCLLWLWVLAWLSQPTWAQLLALHEQQLWQPLDLAARRPQHARAKVALHQAAHQALHCPTAPSHAQHANPYECNGELPHTKTSTISRLYPPRLRLRAGKPCSWCTVWIRFWSATDMSLASLQTMLHLQASMSYGSCPKDASLVCAVFSPCHPQAGARN